MDDKKTFAGDKGVALKLENYSKKLNISTEDLINQYILRGLFRDKYYEQCNISKERLMKIFKIDSSMNEK